MELKPFAGWPPAALDWFAGIEANNNRDWYRANRSTYEEAVRGPLESLLAEVAGEFGDSKVFRQNRDTRFSADKAPYKLETYAAVGNRALGGWFIRLNRTGLFVGGGLFAPDSATLGSVRAAIDADETGLRLQAIARQLEIAGLPLRSHESLKTAPRGYRADHPRIDLLRMKHLVAGVDHPAGPWLHTGQAKARVVDGWRTINPLLDWLDSLR